MQVLRGEMQLASSIFLMYGLGENVLYIWEIRHQPQGQTSG
jgi:hypothetical protein